uniref:Uncharacterized protein n=1 Tax=Mycena chlorophos TaxID=658473 RepID=A0ABQ0LFQ7_MYCCL|nr:predicted protein [Mycena chlorophos]
MSSCISPTALSGDKEFEEAYGVEALKNHEFPTEEELYSSSDEEDDADEDDEDEVAGGLDPDVEMSPR